MSRPILICSLCGKHMSKGRRVLVTLNWEYDASDIMSRIQKNKMICRTCATKIAKLTGMEVPNV